MPEVAANGIRIAYDEFGDPKAPAILLIMGLGTQMIAWPVPFCQALADSGFRVVRFDNRDIGLSTKFERAAPVNVAASFARALIGRARRSFLFSIAYWTLNIVYGFSLTFRIWL